MLMHFEKDLNKDMRGYDNDLDFDFEGQTFLDSFDYGQYYKNNSYIKNQKIKKTGENNSLSENKRDKFI